MESKLMPCPFCGGSAKCEPFNSETWFVHHYCKAFSDFGCKVQNGQEFMIIRKRKEDAEKVWNRRVSADEHK